MHLADPQGIKVDARTAAREKPKFKNARRVDDIKLLMDMLLPDAWVASLLKYTNACIRLDYAGIHDKKYAELDKGELLQFLGYLSPSCSTRRPTRPFLTARCSCSGTRRAARPGKLPASSC